MIGAQVLVLAKEPLSGKVKTRLTPTLTGEQAALVAEAALLDTLDAVRRTDCAARLLVIDGFVDAPGFLVLPQVTGPLDERLAAGLGGAGAATSRGIRAGPNLAMLWTVLSRCPREATFAERASSATGTETPTANTAVKMTG